MHVFWDYCDCSVETGLGTRDQSGSHAGSSLHFFSIAPLCRFLLMEYSPFFLARPNSTPPSNNLKCSAIQILPAFPFPKVSLSSWGPISPAVLWGVSPSRTELKQGSRVELSLKLFILLPHRYLHCLLKDPLSPDRLINTKM